MPYCEVNGSTTYYCGVSKAGHRALLFCHGSGGRHQHWLYQVKALKMIASCIALDLPGHGRSAGQPASEIETYSRWLQRFTEALALTKPVIIGHSMGGAIALDYALRYPEALSGLVIVGSGARLKVLPALLDSLQQGMVPLSLADYLYGPNTDHRLLINGRKEIENTEAAVYYADLNACNRFDLSNKIERINVPALIICGSEDRLTPPKYSHFLADQIDSARLTIIEGAGHMVMLEKPDVVAAVMAPFIESLAN